MDEFSLTLKVDSVLDSPSQTLNLDILRTFVAICETGTFRRAAVRVHRTPSAISLQIGKLEEQLGAQLLIRDARRVDLTERGSELLSYARQLLRISDEALTSFKGVSHTGHMRLAAPYDLGVTLVPKLLHRFACAFPRVVVDVRLDTADAIRHLFLEGEVNLALLNEVHDPSLKLVELYAEELVWVMKEGGCAVEGDPLPLAIAEINCAWRHAALAALESVGQKFRVAYSSDTSLGQVAALQADLAIAALPVSLAGGGLVVVPKRFGLPSLPNTHVYLGSEDSELASSFAKIVSSMPF